MDIAIATTSPDIYRSILILDNAIVVTSHDIKFLRGIDVFVWESQAEFDGDDECKNLSWYCRTVLWLLKIWFMIELHLYGWHFLEGT